MGELSPGTLPEKPSEERLDSWKEIAAYLNRDVTTVQRWEKREGMPVHRHVHDKRGSVYALTPELDAWRQSRRASLEEEEKESAAQTPVDTEGDRARRAMPPARLWLALAGVAVLAVLAVAYIMSLGRTDNAARPQINAQAPDHGHLSERLRVVLESSREAVMARDGPDLPVPADAAGNPAARRTARRRGLAGADGMRWSAPGCRTAERRSRACTAAPSRR